MYKRIWLNDIKLCKSKVFVCKLKNYFVFLDINFYGFRKIYILKEIKKFFFFLDFVKDLFRNLWKYIFNK